MFVIVWLLPVVFFSGIGLAAAALVRSERWPRSAALVQATAVAAAALAVAAYAASDDHYRADGTSRWEAYDAKGLTSAAVALGLLSAAAVAVACWRNNHRAAAAALVVTSVAAVLQFLSIFANSLN